MGRGNEMCYFVAEMVLQVQFVFCVSETGSCTFLAPQEGIFQGISWHVPHGNFRQVLLKMERKFGVYIS